MGWVLPWEQDPLSLVRGKDPPKVLPVTKPGPKKPGCGNPLALIALLEAVDPGIFHKHDRAYPNTYRLWFGGAGHVSCYLQFETRKAAEDTLSLLLGFAPVDSERDFRAFNWSFIHEHNPRSTKV